MPRTISKFSEKAGMPPGTLVHVGRKKTARVKIKVFDYDGVDFTETEAATVEACLPFRDTPRTSWIAVTGVHEVDPISRLGEHFGIHPLVLEDILNTEQRSKVEFFDDYIFIVMKILHNDSEAGLFSEQLSLILGTNFVITFREKEGELFESIEERIRSGRPRIRNGGADYLAYAVMDAIIDDYFVVLESVEEQIEAVEDELLADANNDVLHDIFALKQDAIFLRKTVWPIRELIASMERHETPLIKSATDLFFRDIYDHTVRVIETIESFREMLAGFHDIYLSSLSNKMNAVMKMLSIIATIFIPLTFIAGIYGMNFEYMPELKLTWGYPAVLAVMLVITICMLIFFKRKKWI